MLEPRHARLAVLLVLLAGCASTETAATPAPESTTLSPPPTTVAAVTWVRTWAGPAYGAFFDLTLTGDGGILAVGATNHLHMPPYSGDALLVKLTREGETLWERTWGGEGYEQAFGVEPTGEGGYYVFGETDSYGAGGRDFFLLRVSAEGAEEWHRTYGRADREWPYGMLRLAGGDLLLFGFSESAGGTTRNQYAVRVGPDGEVLWELAGDAPGEELILDALETPNGDLVLAVAAEEDGKLVRLDAAGHLLWQKRYELAGWQYASQVAPAGDGEFLLAGFSMSTGPPQQADTWLARCSSTGELMWQTTFGDPGFDDYATSLIRLSDGTYLAGAIADGMLLSRVDQDGNVLWRRSPVGDAVHGAMGLLELPEGGYLVAGLIQLVPGRSYDAVLLQTDPEGRITE